MNRRQALLKLDDLRGAVLDAVQLQSQPIVLKRIADMRGAIDALASTAPKKKGKPASEWTRALRRACEAAIGDALQSELPPMVFILADQDDRPAVDRAADRAGIGAREYQVPPLEGTLPRFVNRSLDEELRAVIAVPKRHPERDRSVLRSGKISFIPTCFERAMPDGSLLEATRHAEPALAHGPHWSIALYLGGARGEARAWSFVGRAWTTTRGMREHLVPDARLEQDLALACASAPRR